MLSKCGRLMYFNLECSKCSFKAEGEDAPGPPTSHVAIHINKLGSSLDHTHTIHILIQWHSALSTLFLKFNSVYGFLWYFETHLSICTLCVFAFKYMYMQIFTHMITHSVWPRLQSHAGPSLHSHLFSSSWPHPNLPRLSTSLRADWQKLHLWPLKVISLYMDNLLQQLRESNATFIKDWCQCWARYF